MTTTEKQMTHNMAIKVTQEEIKKYVDSIINSIILLRIKEQL